MQTISQTQNQAAKEKRNSSIEIQSLVDIVDTTRRTIVHSFGKDTQLEGERKSSEILILWFSRLS